MQEAVSSFTFIATDRQPVAKTYTEPHESLSHPHTLSVKSTLIGPICDQISIVLHDFQIYQIKLYVPLPFYVYYNVHFFSSSSSIL